MQINQALDGFPCARVTRGIRAIYSILVCFYFSHFFVVLLSSMASGVAVSVVFFPPGSLRLFVFTALKHIVTVVFCSKAYFDFSSRSFGFSEVNIMKTGPIMIDGEGQMIDNLYNPVKS